MNNQKKIINAPNSLLLAIIICIQMGCQSDKKGYEPLYGAYPASFHSKEVAAKIEQVALKYKRGNIAFSPSGKQMLIEGMNLAAEVTKDKKYSRIAAQIDTIEPALSDPELTEDQQKQLDLYKTLSEIPLLEGNISTELAQSLTNNFQQHEKKILESLQAGNDQKTETLTTALYLHNTLWGINRPAGMMWLYHYKVPSIRSYLYLSERIHEMGGADGEDHDVLADAALLLAFAEAFRLSAGMSYPPEYVMTERYAEDLSTLHHLIEDMEMPGKAASIDLMKKAAEAQMKNLFTGSAADTKDADRGWYRGALFAGIAAAWRATNDNWYLLRAEELSGRTKWQPGPNAMHDGNDLAITQTYLELYEAGIPAAQIQPTQLILDSLIRVFDPEKVEWSWCDALFMAPPAWARMGKITGEAKYFNQMDKLWWQTSNLLFDTEDKLFYRDLTYVKQDDGFQIKERNGEKIFWGRGNGWVMGGLCRVMEYLPDDYPSRSLYESMFREMCHALLNTQGEDGLWRASLLDPDSYPMGETSSSTFNCYAFAWGINHGLLDEATYKPAALKAWKALSACLNSDTGLLEYVQLPADSPLSPVYKTTNSEYATGAYLLAGSEIIQLLE